jgi:hypothetical protein
MVYGNVSVLILLVVHVYQVEKSQMQQQYIRFVSSDRWQEIWETFCPLMILSSLRTLNPGLSGRETLPTYLCKFKTYFVLFSLSFLLENV